MSAPPLSEEPARAGEKKPARAQPARRPPPDERLIDSPTKPTLVILGAISLATLIMWGAGRAACNYRVPGESLTPRAVSLEERTASPKDLGLEFAQALSGGDFATARLLATGAALARVESEAKACPGGCAERAKLQPELSTVAELLKYNPMDSYVRTRSMTASALVAEHLLEVEREGRAWKVTNVLPASADVPELKQPDPSAAGVPDPSVPAALRAP